ncbi:MAG: o-succinylbenzoate synthase, partial [Anaerolineales bacterium]
LLVHAITDVGEGWGECVAGSSPGYSYETTSTAWHILVDFLLPPLFREPRIGIERYRARDIGIRGHPMARAAVEMALWDAEGHIEGKSLQALVGGSGARVSVGVSVGIQANPETLVEVVARYVDEGYRRVKLKIKPGRDRGDVQAVRRAFPDLPLQVDANSAYRLEEAATLQALDEFGLLMIEQPLDDDDLVDHSRLQRMLKTPLCLDESLLSARHARHALEIGACRILNLKAGRLGGLSEAVAAHDVGLALGAPVWCGGMLETGIGRASNLALASLPGFTLPADLSATDRYYERDVIRQRFVLNPDSTIDVPTEPGLGVDVDFGELDRVTVKKEVFSS